MIADLSRRFVDIAGDVVGAKLVAELGDRRRAVVRLTLAAGLIEALRRDLLDEQARIDAARPPAESGLVG